MIVWMFAGLACGFDTGGVATSAASLGMTSDSADEDDDDATQGDSSSASAGSVSTSGGLETTVGSATSDPTDAGSESDPTSASVTTFEETSASDGTSDTGTPQTHHLQHTGLAACNEPLWCHYDADIWDPAGNPTYSQQCFISPVAPPYEVLSVHYVVAAVAPELSAFILEVRSRAGGAPGGVIQFAQLTAADATPGSHEYVFPTPLLIADPEFCIGFASPYVGLAGALGIAVDAGTEVGNASYIRIEGSGGCNVAAWTDVILGLDPNPSGNWCIDVTIRETQ